jgi:hypothetical protein
MTSEGASRLTLAAVLVGAAAIIYTSRKQPFATTYRRVWGLALLGAGGALLSDISPSAVGPYMALVALVFLLAPTTGLGGLLKAAESSAGSGASKS